MDMRCMLRAAASTQILIALAMAAALTGCHATPTAYKASGLAAPSEISFAASRYWNATHLPDICEAAARKEAGGETRPADGSVAVMPARPRIAIAEFTVEFVTDKLETPFKPQPVAGATEYGYIGLPLTLIGVGRKKITYPAELRKYLPDDMYSIFVRELEDRGFVVMPPIAVADTSAYSNFTTSKAGSTRPGQLLNVIGSDTGRTKRVEYWPAEGLFVIRGAAHGSLAANERKLLDQTGADAVMRVRMRVGVWRGLASVERESRVEVTTRQSSGKLTAKRSLTSSDVVIDRSRFRLFQGSVYPVRAARYTDAVQTIFTPYAQMAVDMLKCAPEGRAAE